MQHASFEYDNFQKQAIAAIDREESLLVAAPTGTGKTVIAEYAIEQALARGEGAIYTAPIKALSNQKYRDFKEHYGDKIGILTGDVSINPNAPILIMTTEIYRNTLFEESGRLRGVKWVIFDEVHYLDDWERGTVWEEAIMFSPLEVKLLCLSATVPNIQEIASWIRQILNRPMEVIVETHRPVPLIHLFQCQGRILNTLGKLREQGYLGREEWSNRFRRRHHRRGRQDVQSWHETRALPNRIDKLVAHLQSENRLPCIFFAFGRRRTEELAWELKQFDFLNEAERKQVLSLFDELCARFDIQNERSAQDMRPLIERGIGYHHAGMLPTLKEVIEQLFTSRILKMIFTTETFALGINMPARTVAFDQLRKFYGTHFANLRTRDFYQMAGRAGRRGMDEQGFVYCRVNPHDIPFREMERMIHGKPEPIQSQFNATYATILNLYRQFGRQLITIYPKSLHHFQASQKSRSKAESLLARKCDLLQDKSYLTDTGLTSKGEFASCLYGYELLLAEMHDIGFLDAQDPVSLAVVLSALIYEPRKNDQLTDLPKRFRNLHHTAESFLKQIHRWESKFEVRPYTKLPYFHLARLFEKWAQGETFDKLIDTSSVDEGELIRYVRMVIQLLKELVHAPHVSERLKGTAKESVRLINRGVVDAEKQLRA